MNDEFQNKKEDELNQSFEPNSFDPMQTPPEVQPKPESPVTEPTAPRQPESPATAPTDPAQPESPDMPPMDPPESATPISGFTIPPEPNQQDQFYGQSNYEQPQNNNPYDTRSFNTADYRNNNDMQFNNMQGKPQNKSKGLRVFSFLLAAVLLITLCVGVGYITGFSGSENINGNDLLGTKSVEIVQGTVPTKEGIKPGANGLYTSDQVAALVEDSVVRITIYSETNTSKSALASGVIINNNGYILSNDHIYADIPNAKFVITLNDSRSFKATYVAGDSRSDLCVLKMIGASNLTPATFGDSSTVAAGDDVIAIGNPYGFSGTVTKGIVSCPLRRISFSSTDNSGSTVNYSMRVIQTDAALNSGNSGGALINMYGQVVGINSSKIVATGYEGLCFAIPANDAIKVAESLIENKKVVGRAKLGISYLEISSAASLVEGIPYGLQIQQISIDSDLYNSGLANGDIITEMDSTPITSADVALDIIDSKASGNEIKLKVYITSTKKYKTFTAKLLEDSSVSSYSTKEETQTTTSFYSFW